MWWSVSFNVSMSSFLYGTNPCPRQRVERAVLWEGEVEAPLGTTAGSGGARKRTKVSRRHCSSSSSDLSGGFHRGTPDDRAGLSFLPCTVQAVVLHDIRNDQPPMPAICARPLPAGERHMVSSCPCLGGRYVGVSIMRERVSSVGTARGASFVWIGET